MTSLLGYDIEERILEDHTAVVFRARRKSDGMPVMLRSPVSEFPHEFEIDRLEHALESMQSIDHPGVVRAYQLVPSGSSAALVLEDFGAIPLEQWMAGSPLDLVRFLEIARQVTEALASVHRVDLVHRQISSRTILVNPKTEVAKIGFFDRASRVSQESQSALSANLLEGDILFMAPEQTGRMNRIVDYRCDLYALGAVFFQMLTGRPPFLADERIKLVHAHIAHAPVSPSDLNPAVPQALSEIVLKLLAKSAEDRYQSASGVLADLEWCERNLPALSVGQADASLPLAHRDACDRFLISQKLYGRDEARRRLLESFNGIRSGHSSLCLVTGYAGIGKSSLIAELQKPIVRDSAWFVSGKFDQFRRDVPYASVTQALRLLVRQLLAEPEEALERWRESISEALEPNGAVLVEVLPELERLIGTQRPTPPLPPSDAKNLFRIVLRNFLRACARPQHPLVLFLDDLQWADAASLDLIGSLVSDPETSHLLLIGAYRDNEVRDGHPLRLTLADLASSGVAVETIALKPLTPDDVTRLVADTLRHSPAEVEPLAALVGQKTGCNPFFIGVFLRTLHASGMIFYDAAARRWAWDLGGIVAAEITDNVVDLMAQKMRELPAETRRLCCLAACVGGEFELSWLATVAEATHEEVVDGLRRAVDEGLLLPVRGSDIALLRPEGETYLGEPSIVYRFLHDRVQQAAYDLIPSDDLGATHLSIGRLLLASLDEASRNERVFELVGHLNQGASLIRDPGEREGLGRLNRRAGDRARASTAYAAALRHYRLAIELLPDDLWDCGPAAYALALDLHLNGAECACLVLDLTQMEVWIGAVLDRGHTLLDKVRAYEVRISASIAQGRLLEAVETGVKVLRLLRLRLSLHPSKAAILRDLARTRLATMRRGTEEIARIAPMSEPEKLAAMRIGGRILSAAYLSHSNLFVALSLSMVRLSMAYGHAPESCYAIGAYAIILSGVLGDVEQGDATGRLAIDLVSRLGAAREKPRAFYAVYGFVYHWKKPVQTSVAYLNEGYRAGLEVGDTEYASWAAFSYAQHLFFAGRELSGVEREMEVYCAAIEDMGQEAPLDKLRLFQQLVRNLRGTSESPTRLVGPDYDDERMLAAKLDANDSAEIVHIYLVRAMLAFHWDDYDGALASLDATKAHAAHVVGLYIVCLLDFYRCLALLGREAGRQPVEGRTVSPFLRTMRGLRRTLRKQARHCPENFLHRRLLIDAECLALSRKGELAMSLYEQAIRVAGEHGFPQDEALANELAGRFALRRGRDRVAQSYLLQAAYLYGRWGAKAKAQQLRQAYPRLLERVAPASPTDGLVPKESEPVDGSSLDLESILKASTALSSEVELDRLLDRMMQIVMENAGATGGVFLLNAEGFLEVAASASLAPSPQSGLVEYPESVVQYVRRTEECLVLNDALEDPRFGADPFLRRRRPRAALCLPVMNAGRLLGIAYLENDLSAHAFSPDRQRLLSLLAGQIAVSIQNAQAYEALERKVAERTKEVTRQRAVIETERRKSDELLYNILPFETAQELKHNGFAEARDYESATVLFTDFEGFTQRSALVSAGRLIQEIDVCFKAFDAIVERHGVEKIKTIGDSYMAVGGVPVPTEDHARRVVAAALEMRDFMAAREASEQGLGFRVRIGVHTGPIIAGVVGARKFQYDVWGDTVNVASRMESSGVAGEVNVSEETFRRVRDPFAFADRGLVPAKGKGEMRMLFVDWPPGRDLAAERGA